MKLFKKGRKKDSRTRRNNRIWLLQAKRAALYACAATLVGTGAFAIWQSNALQRSAVWAGQQMISRSASAGFKVGNILVLGREHVPADELLAHLDIKEGTPVFDIDIAGAEKSVSSLSWVKTAAVARRLPDTVVVALQERVPVALWQHDKKIFLIDAEGVKLETETLDAWQNLPLVVGAGAEDHATEIITLMKAEPALARRLASAVRIGDRRWDLHFKDGPVVRLPEKDAGFALSRLARLEENKKIFGRAVAAIDLRLPERIVITPEPSHS